MYIRTESYTGYTTIKNRSICLLISNFSFQRHSFQLLHQKSVEEDQLVQMIQQSTHKYHHFMNWLIGREDKACSIHDLSVSDTLLSFFCVFYAGL